MHGVIWGLSEDLTDVIKWQLIFMQQGDKIWELHFKI